MYQGTRYQGATYQGVMYRNPNVSGVMNIYACMYLYKYTLTSKSVNSSPMTMKMRISRKVEVSFELVAWDSKGVKATWLKPNDEIVTRSRPETSSTDGWAYMMNLFQQILWVQTNHAMSNCGVDLEVDPSPDWKPVKLVTNCNRHVDELGNDSGPNGRPRSTRTEACRRDESDPNRRSLQWSIWLVMKAWINVSIDSWWAIDALLATDVSGSNKLSIFRSVIHLWRAPSPGKLQGCSRRHSIAGWSWRPACHVVHGSGWKSEKKYIHVFMFIY